MISKTLAIALAFAAAANAAPALKARQDDCMTAYNSCIAAGTPQVACSCTLTACSGEDSARNREFCSSATASLTSAAATSAAQTTYACNPAHSYPNGASCISTNGALTLVTAAPATSTAAATTYACNPAHSYPNGASCVSTNGALTLVTPAPASTMTTYACNPAHSYPNGASCVSTNGALSLVTPAPAATTTAYACNPAHSYPNGASCVSTNGALTLVTPTASVASSVASAAASAAVTPAAGSNPTKVDGKTWTVEHFSRYCIEGNTGCDYNFGLTANGESKNCTVVRTPGSNAATESWSNEACGDYKVSWGYVAQPAPAFAVMTVVDGKELAWFGVSDINGKPVTANNPFGSGSFGDLAPQQVYTY